jgi:hypothetical protein
MEPRIFTIQAGDAVQILDDSPEDEGELSARIRAAREAGWANNTAALVVGGHRASPDAGLVIALVDGKVKVVKNRRGPTDNA